MHWAETQTRWTCSYSAVSLPQPDHQRAAFISHLLVFMKFLSLSLSFRPFYFINIKSRHNRLGMWGWIAVQSSQNRRLRGQQWLPKVVCFTAFQILASPSLHLSCLRQALFQPAPLTWPTEGRREVRGRRAGGPWERVHFRLSSCSTIQRAWFSPPADFCRFLH